MKDLYEQARKMLEHDYLLDGWTLEQEGNLLVLRNCDYPEPVVQGFTKLQMISSCTIALAAMRLLGSGALRDMEI